MKKTPLRKKAKPKSRGWYNKKLDDIAKGFAKERDGYICQKSGESVEGCNAHGSHVIPVSGGNNTRWDLGNIKCLSYHNHLNWWHKNPLEASAWFNVKFPYRSAHVFLRKTARIKITQAQVVEFYDRAKKCENWEQYSVVYEDCFKSWVSL